MNRLQFRVDILTGGVFVLGSVIAISEAVSLGVHGMGLLAASGRRLNARDMAQTLGVSEAHLTKVFQRLARAGLVRSVRGVGGGFELKLAPSQISLMSVYRAIDGPPDPSAALCSCCAQCPFRDCIFDTVLEDSARRFLDYLSGTTLDTVFLKLDKRECPSPYPELPEGAEPSGSRCPRREGRVLAGESGGEAHDAV